MKCHGSLSHSEALGMKCNCFMRTISTFPFPTPNQNDIGKSQQANLLQFRSFLCSKTMALSQGSVFLVHKLVSSSLTNCLMWSWGEQGAIPHLWSIAQRHGGPHLLSSAPELDEHPPKKSGTSGDIISSATKKKMKKNQHLGVVGWNKRIGWGTNMQKRYSNKKSAISHPEFDN